LRPPAVRAPTTAPKGDHVAHLKPGPHLISRTDDIALVVEELTKRGARFIRA
jgi:hypothetical protein